MIAVHNLTAPALAKGETYAFPPVDSYQRSKSDPLAARGRIANSVEVSCTPAKAVTVRLQFSADWGSDAPTWTTLHSLKVGAGKEGRAVFNVEGWRWTRLQVESGAAQGPVSLTATYSE
jgi:hypothetical protein